MIWYTLLVMNNDHKINKNKFKQKSMTDLFGKRKWVVNTSVVTFKAQSKFVSEDILKLI